MQFFQWAAEGRAASQALDDTPGNFSRTFGLTSFKPARCKFFHAKLLRAPVAEAQISGVSFW